MVIAATYRRGLANKEFFHNEQGRWFRTCGWLVVMTGVLSLGLYITLLVLLLRIPGTEQVG